MRIGVLGGSFDPPHLGHLAAAEAAQSALNLDLVIFVPAKAPWQKSVTISADIRSHMTSLAIRHHADWQVSAVDIERDGPTYSVDTVADIQSQWPNAALFFIVGADAAAGLSTWHDVAKLLATVEFVIVDRPGEASTSLPEGIRAHFVHVKTPDVSSTQVREVLANNTPEVAAQLLTAMLPGEVADYIIQTKVYQ